jgi:hypothetical protein
MRSEIALELEHQAVDLLSEAVDHGITAADDLTPQMRAQLLLQTAQARATLAQSIRLGELTDRLGEYLGDDSEHPTPAQRRVLAVFARGENSGANQAMLRRLVDKGWLEGSTKDGYVLTPSGLAEAD